MNIIELQTYLRDTGRNPGAIDGRYGPRTRAAVMLAMTDGPDTKLTDADLYASAKRLSVTVPHIKAVIAVESSGSGFIDGRPSVLFEPHRFSKSTGGRFDASHPAVSYPKWDRTRYPRLQIDRYEQLLTAVGLDVDAGFMSCSYGKFQILGENFRQCGFNSPLEFAVAQAHDERSQLVSFESFIVDKGLDRALRAEDWDRYALGYNGTAYRQNGYHTKLAKAFEIARGKT